MEPQFVNQQTETVSCGCGNPTHSKHRERIRRCGIVPINKPLAQIPMQYYASLLIVGFSMNSVKDRWMERREQDSRDSKKLVALLKFKPRICHALTLLRIHSPDCERCAASLTCGIELRKRLEELNRQMQTSSHENHRRLRRVG